jgi:hypothetical protein
MRKRLEPVARSRPLEVDDIVKQQVPFIERLVRSGEMHWTASILTLDKCRGNRQYLRFCCVDAHSGILSIRSEGR